MVAIVGESDADTVPRRARSRRRDRSIAIGTVEAGEMGCTVRGKRRRPGARETGRRRTMAERVRKVAMLISGRGLEHGGADLRRARRRLPLRDRARRQRPAATPRASSSPRRRHHGRTRWPTTKPRFFEQPRRPYSADRAIDIIALAGYMRILPDAFVSRWAGRMVNIHPSLLPRHKGLRPHDAVLGGGRRRDRRDRPPRHRRRSIGRRSSARSRSPCSPATLPTRSRRAC